ncbi:MAG: BolA/IbaG family iron-sulfur metabolism protein [Halioglobus sp.]|nr:BolA/IbaG family iron-sulfur metabolism protein [Halioglobus sp.]
MQVQQEIEQRLRSEFAPQFLDVRNESHMHSVPENSETHFRVVLVSDSFAGKRSVARHQAVYAVLQAPLDGPVHALALHTYTPQEWHERNEDAPQSPDCLGGSKAEAAGD